MERRAELCADPQPGSLSEKVSLGKSSSRRVGGGGLERWPGTEGVPGSAVPLKQSCLPGTWQCDLGHRVFAHIIKLRWVPLN